MKPLKRGWQKDAERKGITSATWWEATRDRRLLHIHRWNGSITGATFQPACPQTSVTSRNDEIIRVNNVEREREREREVARRQPAGDERIRSASLNNDDFHNNSKREFWRNAAKHKTRSGLNEAPIRNGFSGSFARLTDNVSPAGDGSSPSPSSPGGKNRLESDKRRGLVEWGRVWSDKWINQ